MKTMRKVILICIRHWWAEKILDLEHTPCQQYQASNRQSTKSMEYYRKRKGNQHLITINTTEEDEVAGEEARKCRVQMKMSQTCLQDGTTLLSENKLAGVKKGIWQFFYTNHGHAWIPQSNNQMLQYDFLYGLDCIYMIFKMVHIKEVHLCNQVVNQGSIQELTSISLLQMSLLSSTYSQPILSR